MLTVPLSESDGNENAVGYYGTPLTKPFCYPFFGNQKPDNCGFDVRDTLKLFDFGLARELSEVDRDENGLYKMTSMTGAIRYMGKNVQAARLSF